MNRGIDLAKDVEEIDDSTPMMRDNLDTDFIIHDIKSGEGDHGEWMIAYVSEKEKGPRGQMFVSGKNVLKKLHTISDAKGFPCIVQFIRTKHGFDIK